MYAFNSFAARMRTILTTSGAHVVNVSIRHAKDDTTSLMRWADRDMFCFVLYHKQRSWQDARAAGWRRRPCIGPWTFSRARAWCIASTA